MTTQHNLDMKVTILSNNGWVYIQFYSRSRGRSVRFCLSRDTLYDIIYDFT